MTKTDEPSPVEALIAHHKERIKNLQEIERATATPNIAAHAGKYARLHEGYLAAAQALLADNERLRAEAEREERSHGETIDQRDLAEETVAQAFYLITGRSPDWSSAFGFAQALEEIEDACALLRQAARQALSPSHNPETGK